MQLKLPSLVSPKPRGFCFSPRITKSLLFSPQHNRLVAPAELEVVLLSYPEIFDAVVIPFPDAEAGEVPIAYVVRGPKSALKEQDVMKFVADQVAPYKKLRKVTFSSKIPKSAAGKLLRRELIELSRSKL